MKPGDHRNPAVEWWPLTHHYKAVEQTQDNRIIYVYNCKSYRYQYLGPQTLAYTVPYGKTKTIAKKLEKAKIGKEKRKKMPNVRNVQRIEKKSVYTVTRNHTFFDFIFSNKLSCCPCTCAHVHALPVKCKNSWCRKVIGVMYVYTCI